MRVDFSRYQGFTQRPGAVAASLVAGLTVAIFALLVPESDHLRNASAPEPYSDAATSSPPPAVQNEQPALLEPALRSLDATASYG